MESLCYSANKGSDDAYDVSTSLTETKGPSLGIIQKGDTRERNLCAPKFEERTPQETSRQEDCARKVAWNLAKIIYKLKVDDKATFFFLLRI